MRPSPTNPVVADAIADPDGSELTELLKWWFAAFGGAWLVVFASLKLAERVPPRTVEYATRLLAYLGTYLLYLLLNYAQARGACAAAHCRVCASDSKTPFRCAPLGRERERCACQPVRHRVGPHALEQRSFAARAHT